MTRSGAANFIALTCAMCKGAACESSQETTCQIAGGFCVITTQDSVKPISARSTTAQPLGKPSFSFRSHKGCVLVSDKAAVPSEVDQVVGLLRYYGTSLSCCTIRAIFSYRKAKFCDAA